MEARIIIKNTLVGKLWKRLARRKNYSGVEVIESVNELPKNLGARIFLVSRGGILRWAIMACPCKCGDSINANLMESHSPCWQVKWRGNKISIKPSLWVSEDKCGSHFWIKSNHVYWVDN